MKKDMKRKKEYKSEKEIKIGRKSFWLTKTDNMIVVVDGKKEVFNGTTYEYQAWVRNKKFKKKAKK